MLRAMTSYYSTVLELVLQVDGWARQKMRELQAQTTTR